MRFISGVKNILKSFFILIYDLFTSHPKSIGESYLTHMFHSLVLCLCSLVASCIFLVHALFPFLFKEAGSNIISSIEDKCSRRESYSDYNENDFY